MVEASGVAGDVLAGEEALEERLESALGSGISSGIDQRPLICSNSCTWGRRFAGQGSVPGTGHGGSPGLLCSTPAWARTQTEGGQRPSSWPDAGVRKVGYLLLDQRHDSNAGQHLLATQPLPGDPIREGLRAICPRLTQMAHEQRHVGPGMHGAEGRLQGLRGGSGSEGGAEITTSSTSTPQRLPRLGPRASPWHQPPHLTLH